MNEVRSNPLVLTHGNQVQYRGKTYIIKQESINFETIVLCDADTGELTEAPISELLPPYAKRKAASRDLSAQDPKALAKAKAKYELIKSLINNPNRTTTQIKELAKMSGVHYTSIYNWLRNFETTGTVSALIRQTRSDKGKSLLDEKLNSIITSCIDIHFLTKQKKSAAKVIVQICKACAKEGITAPHPNTIRNRIKGLDSYQKLKAREGNKAARDKYAPIKGHIPGANFPLAITQIDHTLIDMILVDDVSRQPIGRPWLTLIMDVYSRMVLGFYISFDPPGNLSTGLCLSHAFLRKESWLAKFDIEAKWPCWGKPRTILADNAREFRGNMLKKACGEYGITLEWRPVKTPHYGGHIESLLGTLNEEIKALPGATFSNPKMRGTYNSDKEAVMSLSEFERCFTILCTEIYHQKKHSQIGMSPLAKWEEGIFGNDQVKGIGMPPIIIDEQRLKLDLMPYEMRTVQPYGIVWDHIEYQHDVLRRWINAQDPDNVKAKQKFLCRRDPRDISSIWFYDPEVEQHYQIPYRNTSHPSVSIWEWRKAEKRAEESYPDMPIDENLIFSAYDKIQGVIEKAKKETKAVRKEAQRKRIGIQSAKAHLSQESKPTESEAETESAKAKKAIAPKRVVRTFEIDDMQEDDS